MIKNYFKIAFRNLWKNKVYSFINIFGLMIGLGCFLLIALYIFDELTFDGFHKRASGIYRVVENKTSTGGKASSVSNVAYQVSQQTIASYPAEVQNTVRLVMQGRDNFTNPENTNVFYETIWTANSGFLETFDFPIIEGDRKTALKEPYSIAITEETAIKFFGTSHVIGKALQTDRDKTPFRVTAVLKNIPVNSHLSFNLLTSESTLEQNAEFRDFANRDWTSNSFITYLLLAPNANEKKVEQEINKLVAANRKPGETAKSSFTLQALKNIHFHSENIEGYSGRRGNLTYIYIFAIVGLFVLLVACINYMNLTTARFASRAKEIAVRKFAGASRKNLIYQFLSEAILMTFFALILALIATKLFLPYFNSFTEKNLLLGAGTDYRIWAGIIAIVVVVGLISGTYPALIQSRALPLSLLKNKISADKNDFSIRKVLVVIQFALSIIMIAATMIVYLQLKYINTKDLGFEKDHMLVLDINSGKVRRGAETIKTELSKLSSVKNVSVSSRVPGEWKNLPRAKVKNEAIQDAKGTDMYFIGIDDKFLSTYNISLLKGRNFTAENIADSSAVLINETAAKMLGIKQTTEQLIEIPAVDWSGSIESLNQPFKARVIGIVNDFNFQSLRETISPMVLAYQKNPIHSIDYFTAKISGQDIAGTLKQMEKVVHQVDPSHLFEYNFLDKQWELFYREDRKRQTIFIAVAILTILIACLGLFGLATYAAEQRIREIGIRKVLGASIGGIISMLCKDFLKLVFIAAIIAIPVAWFVMHKWLLDFAYRMDISWWIFVVAGLSSVVIALATISFQAIKAALANPVKSLRSE